MKLAQRHIDHAAVIYERAVGSYASDTVRCMIESVRLGLRVLMGGRWGAELAENSRQIETKKAASRSRLSGSTGNLMSKQFVADTLQSIRSQSHIALQNKAISSNTAALPQVSLGGSQYQEEMRAASTIMMLNRGVDEEQYEENPEETHKVNMAAIDVSRRLDRLATVDAESADKYSRKCSNLIAMAELLASQARKKTSALARAAKDSQWTVRRENKLPKTLSNIFGRKLSIEGNGSLDNSRWPGGTKSAISITVPVAQVDPSASQENSVGSAKELSFYENMKPNGEYSSDIIQRPNGGVSVDGMSMSIDDSIARAMLNVDRKKGKKSEVFAAESRFTVNDGTSSSVPARINMKRSVSLKNEINSNTVSLGAVKKPIVVKLPKFSKNTFPHKLHPSSSGDWAQSFEQASESLFASTVLMNNSSSLPQQQTGRRQPPSSAP